MPIVPTYDSFQAAPGVLPQARSSMPDVPDVAGQQARQMGGAMASAGQSMGQIALDMQAQANQVRFDAAATQAREALANRKFGKEGFSNLRGGDALFRPDNKYLPDEYGEHLQKDFDAIGESLGNDMQKQMFARYSNDLLSSFKTEAMAHVNREYQGFHLSQARGTIAQRSDDIARSGGDLGAIDRAINGKTEMFEGQVLYVEKGLRQAAYDAAKLTGASDIEANNMARKSISEGLKRTIIDALDKNDVTQADALLKRYGNQDTMDADDVLSVRSHITKAMDAQVGFGVASDVMRKVQPRMQSSDIDQAFNVAIKTESNGRQFGADGKPLTSKAGAIGVAQVMPATAPEAAKLAGLPWDEYRYRNDPEYNKAIGLAYFKKQVQDFGGDLSYAFAAYNAGAGRVRDAIKKAEKSAVLSKNDPAIPAHSWLDFVPAETRDYVAKNMKAYETGQGQPSRPTFQEIDEALRSDPRLANNPGRYRVAREEAERQFNEIWKAIKQQEEDSVANAMRGILQNGGRFSDLPASIRAAVPPKEVDNLLGFAQKISKGDDSTSPWLYAKLAGNPDALVRMSDNEFFSLRRELSEADFKHFSNERAKRMGGGGGSNGPGDLNTQAIKQSLDERLRMLQIDPTPKDDGSAEAARIGGIRRFVDQYFMAAQREAGKKFSDAEVVQHIDALFAKNATFRGWFSDSSGPMLTMNVGDIDGATRDNLKAAFKRQGIDSPTDAQILNAYWNMKVSRK